MILQGLVILLVILIVSNVIVGVYNRISPPCQDAEEFFRGAKMLPDGASASLGSIPTSSDHYYMGAKTVPTGIPGVIGITSHNTYLGSSKQENYINPVVNEMSENESDCTDKCKNEKISDEAKEAINNIFPIKKSHDNKLVSETNGSINEFDNANEGISAKPSNKLKHTNGNHMALAHRTLRDGYSDRRIQSSQ
jgi:hypothetical protein